MIKREAVRDAFSKRDGSYVATDLTFPRIDEIEAAKAAKAGTLGAAVVGDRVHAVPNAPSTSKPWWTR